MASRWWSHRRLKLQWVALALAGYAVVSVFLRGLVRSTDAGSIPTSPCRADMAVNILPPMDDDNVAMIMDLFTYITSPNRNTCRKVLKFGGMAMLRVGEIPFEDGHKFVCVDPEFTILRTENCLVYSFGVSDDWSFDWDMESFGCTVYAFDPSINKTTGYQNGTIVFFNYGIGDRNYFETELGWEVRTLDTFVNRLNHSDRTIHYLKMDVEDSEWMVLKQQVALMEKSALFKNVEQLGLELHFITHLPIMENIAFFREVYQSFLRLQEMGFYLFSYEQNLSMDPHMDVPGLSEKLPSAMEVVWLKSRCAPQRHRLGAS